MFIGYNTFENPYNQEFADFFVKHCDDLGRVAIPKEIRKAMKIKYGDAFMVTYEGDTVILRKLSNKNENIESEKEKEI